jgi:hypothetical protein
MSNAYTYLDEYYKTSKNIIYSHASDSLSLYTPASSLLGDMRRRFFFQQPTPPTPPGGELLDCQKGFRRFFLLNAPRARFAR